MNIVPIKQKAPKAALILRCISCGATCEAGCDCGVGYKPAGELAEAAIKALPEMSSRAIAAATGIHHTTIGRARKPAGANAPPDACGAPSAPDAAVEVRRIGKDGKSYPATPRKPEKPLSRAEQQAAAVSRRRIFMRIAETAIRRADQGAGLVHAAGPEIDDAIMEARRWRRATGPHRRRTDQVQCRRPSMGRYYAEKGQSQPDQVRPWAACAAAKPEPRSLHQRVVGLGAV